LCVCVCVCDSICPGIYHLVLFSREMSEVVYVLYGKGKVWSRKRTLEAKQLTASLARSGKRLMGQGRKPSASVVPAPAQQHKRSSLSPTIHDESLRSPLLEED
jgi:hypothetical protein